MRTESAPERMTGRAASMLQRRMSSQGKAGLLQASNRERTGFHDVAPIGDIADASEGEQVTTLAVETALPKTVAVASGREASIERRKALAQGRIDTSSAHNRVRGEEYCLQGGEPSTANVSPPAAVARANVVPEGGRAASLARRFALSKGKAGLPQSNERVRSASRKAAPPEFIAPKPEQSEVPESVVPAQVPRQGSLKYPVRVPTVTTGENKVIVTGLSQTQGCSVTGDEAGRGKPLTGTHNVASEEGGYRSPPSKVGHARTQGGKTVSGTMVRSTVPITGDEDSAEAQITGNADQTASDDLGARATDGLRVGAQFPGQTQPHGHSVFGAGPARSALTYGSLNGDTGHPVEQTLKGHAVSGTAIGRSDRVTGDESGAHRTLTGTQYLAKFGREGIPVRDGSRVDPVSGSKVSPSRTRGGQTVTGPQIEHNPRVTGSGHGTCQTLTGTPYFGASGNEGRCDPETVETGDSLCGAQTPPAVTGDVPMHDPAVSGTDRGASRTITGSAYFVAQTATHDSDVDPVTRSITGFSIGSPQRMAHLAAREGTPHSTESHQSAITGTFAQGVGKITGNVEFGASPRRARANDPARVVITGEGAVNGKRITGTAWFEDQRVTGTEGHIAAGRNPSSSGKHAEDFAGARKFKSSVLAPERTSLVTGAIGGALTRAAVTLSGGAAG